MFRRKILLLIVVLSAASAVKAQYDAAFSHYWALQPFYNPAAVGKDSKINIAAAYAMNLVGFTNSPKTMYVGADMPVRFLNSFHGVGVSFVNDQIGLFKHQNMRVQYACSMNLLGGTLRIGGQVGLLTENFDGSKLDLEDASDPAFISSQQTGHGLDIGAGLYYKYKEWYAGLAAQHINAPLVELGEKNEIEIGGSFYFNAGGNIKLRNPFLSIQPSMIVRTDLVAYKADVTLRGTYTNEEKRFEAGLSYSPGTSFTVLLGGDFRGVSLGYSYEVYTSALNIGNGSHELVMGYQIDMNLYKKGRNKHKSVRFL